MLKLVQMWIKLQIRAKIRGKGGLGFFKLAIGFRKCLMPHDCSSFRGDIHTSNSSWARAALIEFLGCSIPPTFNKAKLANCLPNGIF